MKKIPSMNLGRALGKGKHLMYYPDWKLENSGISAFNLTSSQEEWERIAAVLNKYDLKPEDTNFFLDRLVFMLTLRELAVKYNLGSTSKADHKYRKIAAYLKGVLSEEK